MLLILGSFLYLFFTSTVFGVGLHRFLGLKELPTVFTQLSGLFLLSIFAGIIAIFMPLSFGFHILVLFSCLMILRLNRKNYSAELKRLKKQFLELKFFTKALFLCSSILVILKCATAPYILDNELYYIQTIKWLNEYGYVKGLSNIHFYLGQTSGWHILQSAFDFNFLAPNLLNDLNGFIFILIGFYAFKEFDLFLKSKETKKLSQLFLLIVPLSSLLLFQFISSPSPDLPIILFSLLIFQFLLKYGIHLKSDLFQAICLLCIFSLYIKVSNVYLFLLPIFLFFLKEKKEGFKFFRLVSLGSITLTVFILKNSILTGYPLFPLDFFGFEFLDFKLPDALQQRYFELTKSYAYLMPYHEFEQLSFSEKFTRWFWLPKLHGIFNKLMLAILVFSPIFLWIKRASKASWLIYGLSLVQFLILYLTSPQYRFFLIFILALLAIGFFSIIKNEMLYKTLVSLSLVVTAFLLFIPVELNKLTDNEFGQKSNTFQLNQLILPHKNSKYNYLYTSEQIGNFYYNNPKDPSFYYITGDGKLPVLNKIQVENLRKRYGYIPQLRTTKLKDGFYSKDIKPKR